MNYYERHLGDYAKDTAHLTMIEHGAYSLLLDRYYSTEQGIPEDQAHRVSRARTREERAAVDAVLAEFFTITDGVWTHGRVQREIEKAQGRINAARDNGKNGGRPRKRNPDGTQEKPGGFSLGSVLETQTKALHTPYSIHQEEIHPPATQVPPATMAAKDLVADGVPEAVAVDWLRVRKAKKAPLTRTAWDGVKREAVLAGITPAEAVKVAVESNWQGFKAAWMLNTAGNGQPSRARAPEDVFAGAK